MIEVILNWLRQLAVVFAAICMLLVAVKIIWTIGLPYAMLREPKSRNWSLFPLVELLPFAVGLFVSFIASQKGIFAPRNWMVYVLGAILISYAHLFLVLGIGALARIGPYRKSL